MAPFSLLQVKHTQAKYMHLLEVTKNINQNMAEFFLISMGAIGVCYVTEVQSCKGPFMPSSLPLSLLITGVVFCTPNHVFTLRCHIFCQSLTVLQLRSD